MTFGLQILSISWKVLTIGLVVTSIIMSCSSKPHEPQGIDSQKRSDGKVVLGPGDVLEFKFFNTPQLNETQTILPNGTVTLELVGEIQVVGKTTEEIRKELVVRYSSELKNPEIVVVARSLYSQRIYVGGEVITPGLLTLKDRISVFEAVMQAGGFNLKTANMRNVIVVRYRNGKRSGYSVDCKKTFLGHQNDDFFLEPGDVVLVPKTKVSNANQWIDQHITQMLPTAVWGLLPWTIINR